MSGKNSFFLFSFFLSNFPSESASAAWRCRFAFAVQFSAFPTHSVLRQLCSRARRVPVAGFLYFWLFSLSLPSSPSWSSAALQRLFNNKKYKTLCVFSYTVLIETFESLLLSDDLRYITHTPRCCRLLSLAKPVVKLLIGLSTVQPCKTVTTNGRDGGGRREDST